MKEKSNENKKINNFLTNTSSNGSQFNKNLKNNNN